MYELKKNIFAIFICYLCAILLFSFLSYLIYNDFGIIYIMQTIILFGLYSLFYNKKITYNDKQFTVSSVNLFGTRNTAYSYKDINIIKDYYFGYSIRTKEETIVLNFCEYKKQEVSNFIKYIKQSQTRNFEKI